MDNKGFWNIAEETNDDLLYSSPIDFIKSIWGKRSIVNYSNILGLPSELYL